MSAEDSLNAAMAQLFAQTQMQFGNAIKTYRFHDEEKCPEDFKLMAIVAMWGD